MEKPVGFGAPASSCCFLLRYSVVCRTCVSVARILCSWFAWFMSVASWTMIFSCISFSVLLMACVKGMPVGC